MIWEKIRKHLHENSDEINKGKLFSKNKYH